MDTESLVTETERELRILSTALTDPHDGECLLCYVHRMLEYGCTGLRWAVRYRDLRAPRATALERRLGRRGGYCDCEIFLNGYEPAPGAVDPVAGVLRRREVAGPAPCLPWCTCRVDKGCTLWVRQRRGAW